VYRLAGIYAATASAIIVSFLQMIWHKYQYHKFAKLQILTFCIILVLGGMTLILRNPIFIKWKPSIIYWILAIVFLGSHIIGKKPLIRYMMDKKIILPTKTWNRLNLSWALFFIAIGFINLLVIYTCSTNTWVNFKLFGILGATIIFVIVQAFYLSKYIKDN
jgi:intracellular septation protein